MIAQYKIMTAQHDVAKIEDSFWIIDEMFSPSTRSILGFWYRLKIELWGKTSKAPPQ